MPCDPDKPQPKLHPTPLFFSILILQFLGEADVGKYSQIHATLLSMQSKTFPAAFQPEALSLSRKEPETYFIISLFHYFISNSNALFSYVKTTSHRAIILVMLYILAMHILIIAFVYFEEVRGKSKRELFHSGTKGSDP